MYQRISVAIQRFNVVGLCLAKMLGSVKIIITEWRPFFDPVLQYFSLSPRSESRRCFPRGATVPRVSTGQDMEILLGGVESCEG